MDTSNSVIGVRLMVPDEPLLAPLLPDSNRWTSWLLCRLMRNRIEAADVTVQSVVYGFQLNRSSYRFIMAQRSPGRALAAVREELAAVGLLAWAQIAWLDRDELIWRLYYPESGRFWLPSQQEFDAEARIINENAAAVQKLQQKYGISGG